MVSVGIDVSKEKSMVCILRPYGEVVASPYEIQHTDKDICMLCHRIISMKDEVRVVMEATGVYHLPLLTQLAQAGIFVSVINPLVMKKYASIAIRKGKTDKMDSVRIANFGIDNWFRLESYRPLDKAYEELKLLGCQYAHYISIKVQSKQALSSILDRTMPGIKHLISSKRSDNPTKDKLIDFVERYLHYDNIIQMSEDAFIIDYCEWAKEKRYHPNKNKAKEIYLVASSSITTLSSGAASTRMLTMEAINLLSNTNHTLYAILIQMQAISNRLPEYEVVRAMPGVGEVLAPRLIAEIGDVRRFHSGSALIAFAGIDAPPYESGKFVGSKRSISKRGSSLLRKTGYEAMKCLKSIKPTEDAAVYLYMLKKETEGKAKKVAKIAAFNKFLRIYYARVKEVYSN